MNRLLLFLLSAVLLTACDTASQQTTKPVYYDVAGYVDSQIKALETARPMVQKQAQLGSETQPISTTAINWSRELDLFRQADLNKPAFRSSYAIARPDSLTYRYTLKPTEEALTVRTLTVQLDSATRQPRRIEATLVTKNPLYNSERHLLLESGTTSQRGWGIRQYQIRGFQHLRVSDKNTFVVEGEVK
jgi:hypothetical protein